jgi:hypothetical protein
MPTKEVVLDALGTTPPGWSIQQAPAVYSEDNLWEWIDGEATEVLSYDFSFAVAAIHVLGDVRVEVGAFVMRSPLDAFGYFSRQWNPESKPAPWSNASFWEDAQLHIWRNYVYMRFLPSAQDAQARNAVRQLAEAVIEKVPAADKIPPLLTLLPKNNQVPMSLGFTRNNVLGQAKLKNGVKADYRSGDKVMTAWVLDCGDKEAAREALALLAVILGKTRSISALGDEAFAGTSQAHGPAIAMREERYVAFVVKAVPPDFAEALLRMLTVRIRIAEAEGE